MNIRYSNDHHRFEAEFHEFAGDLESVKAAGFRYDGESRLWHTSKLKSLNLLRQHKPASGLTITPEALAIYNQITEITARKVEIKRQFKQTMKIRNANISNWLPDGKQYILAEDLPPSKPYVLPKSNSPVPPHGECVYCGQPTYLYELRDTCIWCEKTA